MTEDRRLILLALAVAAATATIANLTLAQDQRPGPATPREPSYEAWIDRCKQYQERYAARCRENPKPDKEECELLQKYIGAYCPI